MDFKFLDYMDALIFVRADAVRAVVEEHNKLFKATFPLIADTRIERGMRIVFVDEDANGADLVRYFEVRNEVTSCAAGTQEIEAEDLLMAELTDSMMDSINVSHGAWNDVVETILYTTIWQMGNTIPSLPSETVEYDVYTIDRPNASYLDLRASPSSGAKSKGRYKNGTEVRKVSTYNSAWLKVSVGGKTGYMYTSYLTFERTVTVSGLPTITMTETYKSRYDLLIAVLDKVGLRPIPRIVRSGSALTRYVDFDLTQLDAFRGNRIEIDRNAYADSIETSDRGLYTRVYPVGKDGLTIASVLWDTANGNPGISPSGYAWVEDPAATALYGRQGIYPRTTMVEFSDIDNAVDLINAGWEWLQAANYPTVSVSLSNYDLAALGYGGKPLIYGELVNVILSPIDQLYQLNVVELTRDLENRANTQVTIGAFGNDSISQAVNTSNSVEAVADSVTKLKNSYLDTVYPVGAIYMSVNGTDPGTLFGGTWSRITDRFLLAAGSTYSAGDTGGASTHKHLGTSGYNSSNQGVVVTNGEDTGTVDKYRTSGIDASGSSSSGITVPYTGNSSSMPPYLAVYIWKRTA
jgi:hypothetical protein